MILISDAEYKDLALEIINKINIAGEYQKIKPVVRAMMRFEADMQSALLVTSDEAAKIISTLTKSELGKKLAEQNKEPKNTRPAKTQGEKKKKK